MAKKRMGFEGQFYVGVAGSTAATLVTNSRDITITFDEEIGDTTERGDSTIQPIETGRATIRKMSIEWGMFNKDGDTALAFIYAAAMSATPIAVRTKDKIGGAGCDFDAYITVKDGKPIKGEQTLDFATSTITDENRTPVLYA